MFFVPSVEELRDSFRRVRPTLFSSTPVLWNELRADYEKLVEANMAKLLADEPAKSSNEDESDSETSAEIAARDLADCERERKARDQAAATILKEELGGRLRVASCGGAPTPAPTKAFLNRLGVMVQDGYGATEIPGILGDDGRARNDVQVRLEPVPELGLDGVTRGEIVAKGERLFSEYLGDSELTKKAFTKDGFYRVSLACAFVSNFVSKFLFGFSFLIVLSKNRPEMWVKGLVTIASGFVVV